MRAFTWLRTSASTCLQSLGCLSLLAMLALSSPGVVTTAWAEPLVSEVPAGPSCNLAEVPSAADQMEHLVEAARQRAEANPDVVVLNNQGYRYGGTTPEGDVKALIQKLIEEQQRGAE